MSEGAANRQSPWPLHRLAQITPDDRDRARIAKQYGRCVRSGAFLSPAARFGSDIASGYLDAPMAVLEDHRAIDLMPPGSVPLYEYRSYGLARVSDIFVLSRPRLPAFERYVDQVLGLASPYVLQVDRGNPRAPDALANACRRNAEALDKVCEVAANAGGFNILPYLASGHSWLLAADIARRTGVPVRVCGPPPRLARRVNDKLWFSTQVRQLLGVHALPPTYSVFGPAAAAAFMRKLARRHSRVVVKLPSSAGSMGNIGFDASFIRRASVSALKALLLQQLEAVGWTGRYPILVGVWETGALSSPSVQMWLPEDPDAAPIIEGLFDQTLTGARQRFIGATSLVLPDRLQSRILYEATMIASLVQRLGYVGRLSLDALIVGEDFLSADLHWIECNGRWGGVSIPMTLATRMGVDLQAHNLVIVQRPVAGLALPAFDALIDQLGSSLYRPGAKEGVVFTEPTGPGERGISFFAVAASTSRSQELAIEVIDTITANSATRHV
jgi:hypothetical protein